MDTLTLKTLLRIVPNFPRKGIQFQDISPLIANPLAFKTVIDSLTEHYKDQQIKYVVGIESRGFIIGAPLALSLNCGFVMIRKPGKLPYKTLSQTYKKEYGTRLYRTNIVMHFQNGGRVLIADDLIATGGTILATIELIKKFKAVPVGACAIIDLTDLKGSQLISQQCPVFCILNA